MRRTPEVKGWLKNPERRERREQPMTLIDRHVMQLIESIERMEEYTKLDHRYDRLIRMRDKALIAQAWIFFKRANENLRVKLKDVYYDRSELMITFHVRKKGRKRKICPVCGEENAGKALFCKKCGSSIRDVEPKTIWPPEITVTKRKSLEYPFCHYVVDWVEAYRKIAPSLDAFLYPSFTFKVAGNLVIQGFNYYKHITVDRFNQILQRLDPTLTSHMFRYGHTEKLLRLGYTPHELKEIGDWESSRMPEIYAKRKGLTKPQKEFSRDIRMI